MTSGFVQFMVGLVGIAGVVGVFAALNGLLTIGVALAVPCLAVVWWYTARHVN